MKNLLVFYIAILAPIPLLLWALNAGNPVIFFVSLGAYIVYRGVTDSLRLSSKNLIKKSERWKYFFPIWYRARYFKELYFQI
jgi:hypothetical protein